MSFKYICRYGWMAFPTGRWYFNNQIESDNLIVFIAKIVPILFMEKIVDIHVRRAK